MRRSSRSRSPRPCWASRQIAQFLRAAARQLGRPVSALPRQDGFLEAPARLAEAIECADGRLRARLAPGIGTRSCCWIPRRSNAAARSRPRGARSWPTLARITTAAATPLVLGHAPASVAPRTARSARVILASADHKERDVAQRLFAIALRGGETIVCDKGYAGARVRRPRRRALRRDRAAPRAQDDPTTACTSRASASASSRSSGRSKINSASNAPSAHPARPTRPDRLQTAGLQRRHLAQPQPRPPDPRLRRSHRLRNRGINHL